MAGTALRLRARLSKKGISVQAASRLRWRAGDSTVQGRHHTPAVARRATYTCRLRAHSANACGGALQTHEHVTGGRASIRMRAPSGYPRSARLALAAQSASCRALGADAAWARLQREVARGGDVGPLGRGVRAPPAHARQHRARALRLPARCQAGRAVRQEGGADK